MNISSTMLDKSPFSINIADSFSFLGSKTYDERTPWKILNETLPMRTNNICILWRNKKNIVWKPYPWLVFEQSSVIKPYLYLENLVSSL